MGPQSLELTPAGRARIHDPEVAIPAEQLQRAWTSYVEQALRAEHQFRRDVHYVLQGDGVQIVDGSTGRIFSDRTWQGGLQQAIEAKEGLPLTSENHTLAQITRQRFHRLYTRLAGMTGTAASCARELRAVYGVETIAIPPRLTSRRALYPLRVFATEEHKWQAIVSSVADMHRQQRPVLVGTRSIVNSELLADRIRAVGIPLALLNGRQDADEAAVVSQAGHCGCVTIATNLAGRGTDIRLGPGVAERGGLHVIVSECHESARIDRQLVGRCGRQGDPGSAQTFVAADDWLLRNFGGWLTTVIQRAANRQGEVTLRLESRIRRIQQAAERHHYAARAALLRQDMVRDPDSRRRVAAGNAGPMPDSRRCASRGQRRCQRYRALAALAV